MMGQGFFYMLAHTPAKDQFNTLVNGSMPAGAGNTGSLFGEVGDMAREGLSGLGMIITTVVGPLVLISAMVTIVALAFSKQERRVEIKNHLLLILLIIFVLGTGMIYWAYSSLEAIVDGFVL